MRQIEISKKSLINFLSVAFGAFLLTFILEHFCEISWSYYPSDEYLDNMNITTITGKYYEKNVRDWSILIVSDGKIEPKISYFHNLHFYLMGVVKDVILPILAIILYVIYNLFKRYVKITST